MFLIYYKGLWWRENSAGYSNNILDAGLYGQQEANAIVNGKRGDKMFNVNEFEIQRQIKEELQICKERISRFENLIK